MIHTNKRRWVLEVGMKQWSAVAQLLVVGFYVPVSLLIPAGLGFLLDRQAGRGFPSYSLIGLGIGTVIMVYGVYSMEKPFLDEAKAEASGKKNASAAAKKPGFKSRPAR